MRVQHEHMIIESRIPIAHILKLEMGHRLNEHGMLEVDVIIQPDMQNDFFQANYLNQNIQFLTDFDSETTLKFSGKIQNVTYQQQGKLVTASIRALSYSIELDEARKRRSFQNVGMKFRALLELMTNNTTVRFNWQAGNDRKIQKPFIQCDETDWEFAKRLASYFNCPIHASLLSEQADFYFGVRPGFKQEIEEATIVKLGVSADYYENGGYENNVPRGQYYYLQVKNRQHWEIGDYVFYQNRRLTIIQTRAIFDKDELIFVYTLGAEGFLHRELIFCEQLVGLSLQGVIREVEKESIKIQLDIDDKEQAHFWWRWMPETGNLGYCMPEVDSRVILTFPTNEEEDAFGLQLLRTNSRSPVYERIDHKQLVTAEDKTIELSPEQLLIAGRNHDVSISLEDEEGIRLGSHEKILILAREQIQLKGNKIKVDGRKQVILQNTKSNIDISTHFNIFAPRGVKTTGGRRRPPTGNQTRGGR